jgi:GNAT superfamily N-acetyltransferase
MITYRIQPLIGHQAKPYICELAALRATVFNTVPEDGESYLSAYTDSPDSIAAMTFCGDDIIGYSVGFPLECSIGDLSLLFSEHGYDPACVFYFCESALLKEFRGQGIGIRMLAEMERHVRKMGRFDYTAFCDDLQRPEKDRFWQKRGYIRKPELIRENKVFWMKSLAWTDLR